MYVYSLYRKLQDSEFTFSKLSVLQELNVRQLTLSTDKDKYGISLRAEPDHMVLGKRLKGAFKSVIGSIKELTNDQLEAFQKTGMVLSRQNQHTSHDCKY